MPVSLYAPRRRRSGRLVLVWMATLVFAVWVTWYITTRHSQTAKPYVNEFLHPVGGGSGRRNPGFREDVVVDE